jgi:hypothetical protein
MTYLIDYVLQQATILGGLALLVENFCEVSDYLSGRQNALDFGNVGICIAFRDVQIATRCEPAAKCTGPIATKTCI